MNSELCGPESADEFTSLTVMGGCGKKNVRMARAGIVHIACVLASESLRIDAEHLNVYLFALDAVIAVSNRSREKPAEVIDRPCRLPHSLASMLSRPSDAVATELSKPINNNCRQSRSRLLV